MTTATISVPRVILSGRNRLNLQEEFSTLQHGRGHRKHHATLPRRFGAPRKLVQHSSNEHEQALFVGMLRLLHWCGARCVFGTACPKDPGIALKYLFRTMASSVCAFMIGKGQGPAPLSS